MPPFHSLLHICIHLVLLTISHLMLVADFTNSIPFAHFDRAARAPRYSTEWILSATGLI
jgi:hypothetical protein